MRHDDKTYSIARDAACAIRIAAAMRASYESIAANDKGDTVSNGGNEMSASKRVPKFDALIENVRVRVYATRSEFEVLIGDGDIADPDAPVWCYPKVGEAEIWAKLVAQAAKIVFLRAQLIHYDGWFGDDCPCGDEPCILTVTEAPSTSEMFVLCPQCLGKPDLGQDAPLCPTCGDQDGSWGTVRRVSDLSAAAVAGRVTP